MLKTRDYSINAQELCWIYRLNYKLQCCLTNQDSLKLDTSLDSTLLDWLRHIIPNFQIQIHNDQKSLVFVL